MTSSQEEGFSCRIENAKVLCDLLVCLTLDGQKDQICYIDASPEVLIFMVAGRGKSSQGRVSMSADFFEDYVCNADSINFAVKLPILIDCLRLFGTSVDTATATLTYLADESIFKLSLEESGVITVCDITPLYVEDFEEVQHSLMTAFRASNEECQIIVKSEPLKEAIQELADSQWLDAVTIEINPDPAYWKLSTGGTVGRSEILIPRSSDAYVTFHCQHLITACYPLPSLLLSMKALSVAKETCVRINAEGILCLQHQIETAHGQDAFFDFLLVPEEAIDVS